jgi:hypothetical protein
MNRLLRLYPAVWRDRYGAEFEALLADRPPGLLDRIDIVRGAIDARLRPQLTGEERGLGRRAWHPAVVATAVAGGVLFLVGSWSLTAQGDPLPYRDQAVVQYTAWIGALLIAAGPLRGMALAAGPSMLNRVLALIVLWSAFLIVGPWPLLLIGFYLFTVACLVTGILRWRPDGPAWLLVVVGSLANFVFNTEGARAWLLVPFGMAWIVVGLLHLRRLPVAEEWPRPMQSEVAPR